MDLYLTSRVSNTILKIKRIEFDYLKISYLKTEKTFEKRVMHNTYPVLNSSMLFIKIEELYKIFLRKNSDASSTRRFLLI